MCALVTGVQTCALPIFNPAFLGRTTVIPFYPLRDDNMRKIVRLKLGKIARRIRANHGASFDYDDALVDAVAARCTEVDSGARNIDHILTGTLLPEIATTVPGSMGEGLMVGAIIAGIGAAGRFGSQVEAGGTYRRRVVV